MTSIPVKYTGEHAVTVTGRVSYNADGSRRASNMLFPGDILLMEEREVLGFTQKMEPGGNTVDLGPGKVTKPEHVNMTPQELFALGYLFHEGRRDFTPVDAHQDAVMTQTPPVAETVEGQA